MHRGARPQPLQSNPILRNGSAEERRLDNYWRWQGEGVCRQMSSEAAPVPRPPRAGHRNTSPRCCSPCRAGSWGPLGTSAPAEAQARGGGRWGLRGACLLSGLRWHRVEEIYLGSLCAALTTPRPPSELSSRGWISSKFISGQTWASLQPWARHRLSLLQALCGPYTAATPEGPCTPNPPAAARESLQSRSGWG